MTKDGTSDFMDIKSVIQRIAGLKTLCIPAIDGGMPYVRLDEVADALSFLADVDVSPIYSQVRKEYSKYQTQEDNH